MTPRPVLARIARCERRAALLAEASLPVALWDDPLAAFAAPTGGDDLLAAALDRLAGDGAAAALRDRAAGAAALHRRAASGPGAARGSSALDASALGAASAPGAAAVGPSPGGASSSGAAPGRARRVRPQAATVRAPRSRAPAAPLRPPRAAHPFEEPPPGGAADDPPPAGRGAARLNRVARAEDAVAAAAARVTGGAAAVTTPVAPDWSGEPAARRPAALGGAAARAAGEVHARGAKDDDAAATSANMPPLLRLRSRPAVQEVLADVLATAAAAARPPAVAGENDAWTASPERAAHAASSRAVAWPTTEGELGPGERRDRTNDLEPGRSTRAGRRLDGGDVPGRPSPVAAADPGRRPGAGGLADLVRRWEHGREPAWGPADSVAAEPTDPIAPWPDALPDSARLPDIAPPTTHCVDDEIVPSADDALAEALERLLAGELRRHGIDA